MAILLALFELTLVHAAVGKLLASVTLHVGLDEVASVGLLEICEVVRSLAVHQTVRECTLVIAAIFPSVLALSVLLTP